MKRTDSVSAPSVGRKTGRFLTIGFSALFAAMALSTGLEFDTYASFDVISSAQAGDHGDHGGAGGPRRSGGGKGAGKQSGSGQGHFAGTRFDGERGMKGGQGGDLLEDTSDDGDESDRPDWAGPDATGDKPGGGNKGGDTQKGGEYGDLWTMLRNDDGTLVYMTKDKVVCDGPSSICFPVTILADGTLEVLYEGNEPDGTVEVEFGRMNIARAPAKVLDHALEEALSKLDGLEILSAADLEAYTDDSGRLLVMDGDTVIGAIDSPLENLAVFKALLVNYSTGVEQVVIEIDVKVEGEEGMTTYSMTVDSDYVLQLAASAIAASSDKTGTLAIDELAYIASFMEVDTQLADLVEDFNDWYKPEEFYDTDVWVLDPDKMGWDKYNLYDDIVATNTQVDPIDDDGNGIDVFTQAADDAVQVLEFLHDNVVRYSDPGSP